VRNPRAFLANRVAFVTPWLDIGGSERQMLLLADHLPEREFDISFILLVREGPGAPAARASGAAVHVIGFPLREASRWGLPVLLLRRVLSVVRFLVLVRRERYAILDAWLYPGYFLAALTRPLTRVPVLVSGRRSLSDYKENWGVFRRFLDRVAARWSDVIVANAQAVADDVTLREGVAASRIRVIRNGVEEPLPMSPAVRSALRDRWSVSEDQIVIGCVSNYKAGKGLEDLVTAAALVCAAQPNARFVLVGTGPLEARLQELIAGNRLVGKVILHGEEPDARTILGAFDVFVQSSASEGLPNVVLEAAAAGIPVVATDAGGTGEVLADGESGLLVPIGNREGLADALKLLVSNPSKRRHMGKAAQRRVRRDFSVRLFVDSVAALYRELSPAKSR